MGATSDYWCIVVVSYDRKQMLITDVSPEAFDEDVFDNGPNLEDCVDNYGAMPKIPGLYRVKVGYFGGDGELEIHSVERIIAFPPLDSSLPTPVSSVPSGGSSVVDDYAAINQRMKQLSGSKL